MKRFFNWNNLNISLQAFFVLSGVMVLYFILRDFIGLKNNIFSFIGAGIGILMPFIIGFSIAYLLNPAVVYIEKKIDKYLPVLKIRRKIKRIISIIVTYVIFVGFLIWFMIIVLPQFYQSLLRLFDQLARGYSEYQEQIDRIAEVLDLSMYLDLALLDQADFSDISDVLTKTIPIVLSKAYSFTSGLFKFFMGIIISIYVIFDKERFIAGSKKIVTLLTPKHQVEKMDVFLKETNQIFKSFFVGKTLDSIIIGFICFIGLMLMGNPYPIVISVIVGITNMIPYFGPFIGAVPGVIITMIYSPSLALWLVLFIFALQQFDGLILGPKILGDSTGIEPFWVLLAIIVGGALFGVLGMLLGVPVFAVIYNVSKKVINRKYDEKMG